MFYYIWFILFCISIEIVTLFSTRSLSIMATFSPKKIRNIILMDYLFIVPILLWALKFA